MRCRFGMGERRVARLRPAIQALWQSQGRRRADALVRNSRSRRQLPRQYSGYGTRRAQLTRTGMLYPHACGYAAALPPEGAHPRLGPSALMLSFRSLAVAAMLAWPTVASASGLDQLHAFLAETKTSKG